MKEGTSLIIVFRCIFAARLSFRTIGGAETTYDALIAIDHSLRLTELPCNALCMVLVNVLLN